MLRRSVFALTLTIFAFAVLPQASAAETTVPTWLKWNSAKKRVEMMIRAGYNGNNGSWNFNGYYEGGATVVVPKGVTVSFRFENYDGNVPHSLLVTKPYTEEEMPDIAGRDHVAVGRAYTRVPDFGCNSCTETVRFKTKKAGKFYFLCGVVGHAHAGMWIGFEISEDAEEPYVLVSDNVMAADDQPPWQ